MSPTVWTPPALSALRLTDWGVIRATGADARRFLHTQLTQDIETLIPGEARLAGWCSAKGRLLVTFVVWAGEGDEVLLACSAGVLPAVLKRLSMFVLRAQCKLSDASAECPVHGVVKAGVDPEAAPWSVQRGNSAWTVNLPPAASPDGALWQRALVVGTAPDSWAPCPPEAWAALEASSGVARVLPATVEAFVPQMVNLELVGGVNFRKGCYPGQEVVARSQYRGTLKRRGFLLQALDTLVAAQPGQEVFHSEDPGQPAGVVALAGQWPGAAASLLCELKIAATLSGSLHLGAADGPALKLAALPYALPAEQA